MSPASGMTLSASEAPSYLSSASGSLQRSSLALATGEGPCVVVLSVAPSGVVLVIGRFPIPPPGGDVAGVIAGTMTDRRLLRLRLSSAPGKRLRVVVLPIARGRVVLVICRFSIWAGRGRVARIIARAVINRCVLVVRLTIGAGDSPIGGMVPRRARPRCGYLIALAVCISGRR